MYVIRRAALPHGLDTVTVTAPARCAGTFTTTRVAVLRTNE
jgi:hypothetical protein